MSIFSVIAVLITIVAIASYINHRYIKLPTTVGLMVIALGLSLGLIGLGAVGVDIETPAQEFLGQIDFGEALMKGMLSFLLFAGALKININDLAKQKLIIGTLATGGVVASTFIIGTAIYFAASLLDLTLPYIYCLVFGALISPTDPVAVLSILKSVEAPKTLKTKIAGESLFNDGIGVVVFTLLVGTAVGGGAGSTSIGHIIALFAEEAIGGVAFGLLIGWVAYRLIKNVDNYTVEVLITLALVTGGYALAHSIHTSGPIAIVVAGLLIGNHGRAFGMSESTRDHLDKFWELIDEILNAVLFVLIGLEILILAFTWNYLVLGLIAIPVVLGARFASVWSAINLLKFRREFSRNATAILTWGGLRGGISIAMALSLAPSATKDMIVSITYVVVVFSILVQGLTISKLVRK